MSEQCRFCGNSGVLLANGYCVHRTRCERRRKELVRQQRELLIRARDLLLRLEIADAALVITNVLDIVYGVSDGA